MAAATAAVIGGSLAASAVGSYISGQAASNISQAQLDEQRATRAAAVSAAAPSADEINQLQQSITLNNQDIQRKQKLIDSSDPALMEAGKQALSLLQGKSAASLNPLKSSQNAQRAQLEDKLRSQLGSGYANTTAGIQALAAFDNAAYQSQAAAQQSSLSTLLGSAQQTSAQYGLQSNISNSGNIATLYGNQSNRMVNAINGTPITAAGAQFTGSAAFGNALSNLGQALPGLNTAMGSSASTNPYGTLQPSTGPLLKYQN